MEVKYCQIKSDEDLMPQMLHSMKSDFTKGRRKSNFPSLSQKIKDGDISEETSDNIMSSFVKRLNIDLIRLDKGLDVSECAFFAPKRGKKNKRMLRRYIILFYRYNCNQGLVNSYIENDEAVSLKAIIFYKRTVSLLAKTFIEQEFKKYKERYGYMPSYWTNHGIDSIPAMVERPFAKAIKNPVVLCFKNDYCGPGLLDYVKKNELPLENALEFGNCTIHPDGRFDSCYEGYNGSVFEITDALAKNDKIKHFLYSYNYMGRSGCYAISELLSDQKSISNISTWCLSGNSIDEKGIEVLVDGLIKNFNVEKLWLDCNPLGSSGASSIKKLLQSCVQIETLCLSNTALFNKGVKRVIDGLQQCNSPLRNLYMSANGIASAKAFVTYYNSLVDENRHGVDSLWLDMNRLTDAEAIPLIYTLGKYKFMKRLYLGYNMLTSESARACYFAFRSHTNIEVLDFGGHKPFETVYEIPNILGDEGASWIAKLIRENKSLTRVDVSHNHLTQKGIDLLVSCLDVKSEDYVEYSFRTLSNMYSEYSDKYGFDYDDDNLYELLSKTKLGNCCCNNGEYEVIKEFEYGNPIVGKYYIDTLKCIPVISSGETVYRFDNIVFKPNTKMLFLDINGPCCDTDKINTEMERRRSEVGFKYEDNPEIKTVYKP